MLRGIVMAVTETSSGCRYGRRSSLFEAILNMPAPPFRLFSFPGDFSLSFLSGFFDPNIAEVCGFFATTLEYVAQQSYPVCGIGGWDASGPGRHARAGRQAIPMPSAVGSIDGHAGASIKPVCACGQQSTKRSARAVARRRDSEGVSAPPLGGNDRVEPC